MILRAHKTEIIVNNKQQTLLLQHIGCARRHCNSSGINASGDGSSSVGESQWVSPSLNEEFNKKSRVYILKR